MVFRRILWILLLNLPLAAHAQEAMRTAPGPQPYVGSVPVPDPTLLTTQAQEKATIALRELFEAKIRSVSDEVLQQKDRVEKFGDRLLTRFEGLPAQTAAAIAVNTALVNEKFHAVDQQFVQRDIALIAALAAQKALVDEQNRANAAAAGKAEAGVTKQIDGISSVISANIRATDDKIDSVKALFASQSKSFDDKISELRTTLVDVRSRGAGQSDLWAYMVAGAGLLIAFLGFIMPKLNAATAPVAPYPPPNYQPPQYAPPTYAAPQYGPPQYTVTAMQPPGQQVNVNPSQG